ncbi:addiction module protein [Candidatus Magnetaquicoccus inordinatus]|uniref:addiction module protein n=1 Tax=Candidatus Magnetaquicoccus inordinatus TaxID=2496818 RepID=UPI00102B0BF3|nr:addiction module protein [Candidatus Magnetaquicoccus inordinatus]
MNNTTAATIESQALKLTPLARLELVDAILSSLDEPNQELDRLWSLEAEERLTAYRRGEIKAIPLDEVLAKHSTP